MTSLPVSHNFANIFFSVRVGLFDSLFERLILGVYLYIELAVSHRIFADRLHAQLSVSSGDEAIIWSFTVSLVIYGSTYLKNISAFDLLLYLRREHR